MYIRIFILRICARRRHCPNEAFLVKIANSNFKQMTPAIASEQSIVSKNYDYNSYIKSFPCRGEHVRTYISGSRCTRGRKLRADTHTHAGQPQ